MSENNNLPLVTVIIPTYNRFSYLQNAIDSVKCQTYPNIEIIVVNDCSTEEKYYIHKFEGITVINLPINSKQKFGFACAGGYQRNFGIKIASGEYIAFLDDDDIWLPNKIELQIKAMKETGCKMSCTEGYFGRGIYNKYEKYKKYNSEHYLNDLKRIYKSANSPLLNNGFPRIWNKEFLSVHNCVICSSSIISKEIIDKVGFFKIVRVQEDYDYWKRTLEHTDCVYVDEPCFYYDGGHGSGQNY